MREYGQIQSAYWTHPDIQALSPETKLIGAYLLTCQHTNGIGCFRIPIGYVSIDLGMGIETVSKGFQELFENGFLVRDERSEFVLLPAFLRWNPISNPNSAKARQKEFEIIPSSLSIFPNLVNALLEHGNYWQDDFRNHIETLSKGLRNGSDRVPEDVRDKRTRPDPTLTQPEPEIQATSSADDKPKPDRVPVQQIVDLYHELLPELPTVQKITDTRRGYIQQRWREDLPDITHWKNFFAHVRRSEFLMGKSPGSHGKPPFRADLEWLTKPANFAKIAEDKYHQRPLRVVP